VDRTHSAAIREKQLVSGMRQTGEMALYQTQDQRFAVQLSQADFWELRTKSAELEQSLLAYSAEAADGRTAEHV
jgi:hypothetical protein